MRKQEIQQSTGETAVLVSTIRVWKSLRILRAVKIKLSL